MNGEYIDLSECGGDDGGFKMFKILILLLGIILVIASFLNKCIL